MRAASVWIGIHDHGDSAPKWLDARSSYTWLRAFEQVSGIASVAYLREFNYNVSVEEPIRGVHYRFNRDGIDQWVSGIISENPNLILYNVCYYFDGRLAVERLRDALPNAVHVIRIHHQVTYLAAQRGFREFLNACDVAIAPTPGQVEDVRNLGFSGPVHHLPFGVNLEAMGQAARDWSAREIQLASAANDHPARNLPLVQEVFESLRRRGRRVENFQGLTPKALAEKLGNTKIFWQTSLTEASGSRILPEAMAAGCYPVVFRECASTTELIERHGVGKALASGIQYRFETKTSVYPDGIAASLTDVLDQLISGLEAEADYAAPPVSADWGETQETARLAEILRESEQRLPRPASRQRSALNLPVDEDGYAFNPAMLQTDAGLLCIYRHVDGAGGRGLRRVMLDGSFSANGFCDWSAELRARGSSVAWHADPRMFRVGSRYFVSFNTGHSETPNNIYLVEIDAFGAPISQAFRLAKPDGRRDIEKNWGFFSHEGEIYAIYSIAPFRVLKVAFENGEAVARPFAEHAWDASAYEGRFGELHGGASPILLGDRGVLVAQSNFLRPGEHVYRGTMLTFEPVPPFRPLRYAEAPLFQLSISECGQTPERRLHASVTECLYPCGAIVDGQGETLTISYGINDFRSGIRTYALSDLEPHLAPVPRR